MALDSRADAVSAGSVIRACYLTTRNEGNMLGAIFCLVLGIALVFQGLSGEKFHARSMRLNVPIPASPWRTWLFIFGSLFLIAALPTGVPLRPAHPLERDFLIAVLTLFFLAGFLAVLVGGGLLCGGKAKARARPFGAGALLLGGSLIWFVLATLAIWR